LYAHHADFLTDPLRLARGFIPLLGQPKRAPAKALKNARLFTILGCPGKVAALSFS
jgi:hypothetical protein